MKILLNKKLEMFYQTFHIEVGGIKIDEYSEAYNDVGVNNWLHIVLIDSYPDLSTTVNPRARELPQKPPQEIEPEPRAAGPSCYHWNRRAF